MGLSKGPGWPLNPARAAVERFPMLACLGMVLALLFGLGPSGGVTVHLKNGKSVHGKLLQETSKFVLLEIDLGQLLVQRKNIKRLVKDAEDSSPGVTESPAPGKPAPGENADKGASSLENRGDQVPPAPGGIAPRTKTPSPKPKVPSPKGSMASTMAPRNPWTVPLQEGRLLDRYTWFYGADLKTQISVALGLLFLFWIGFLLGGRILGVDSITKQRALAASAFWFVLLVGVLLVPNPSLMILGVLLFLILVAWFISSRGVLGLGWFHSFVLLVLGGFGLSLIALVVEVSENLISL